MKVGVEKDGYRNTVASDFTSEILPVDTESLGENRLEMFRLIFKW